MTVRYRRHTRRKALCRDFKVGKKIVPTKMELLRVLYREGGGIRVCLIHFRFLNGARDARGMNVLTVRYIRVRRYVGISKWEKK